MKPSLEPRAFLGVDLGQRRNHTAFAIIDLHWRDDAPRYILRYLRRVPLHTNYVDVHNDIVTLATESPYPIDVAIDAAGPGGPMVDWLRRSLPPAVGLHPIIITGGRPVFRPGDGRTVHRSVLFNGFASLFHQRLIAIPRDVPFLREFTEEITGIRTSLLPAHGFHDDLVVAAALASNVAGRHIAAIRRATGGSE